ncbi:7304_t:CDS:2 [Funneliformis caledonium]|uniref:7304_t:CDS:1 n=1 Tax=Funneliformis caledonium TaxID=1117310 RepID=A0A9N9BF58_9GLOM|nr:7304_t:CDS:2 [Funneliformis caledonium]
MALLIPQRWYTDASVMEANTILISIPAISVISAIETGRKEELYEIHERLAKEMESEITQIMQGNNIIEFACTINNPINIKTKGRKPKISSNIYANRKGKKRQVRTNQNDKENNISDEDCEELLPNRKWQKVSQDNSNTADYELNVDVKAEGSRSKSRQCGICNKEDHNARTCLKINL